jgi:hypothetical protein
MRAAKTLGPACALAVLALAALAGPAQAHYGRQYYGGWSYYPDYGYYYRSYYYQPYSGYDGYNYHYCIYYPSQPSYVYYYNPYKHYYWGRLDLEAKGDNRYSLLEEKDRKASVKDIPESAFPKPGKMPPIPESKDGVPIEPISPDDLPKGKPSDLPKKGELPGK